MTSRTTNNPSAANPDEEDLVNVEDIEQLCARLSKYEPCFRLSVIQYHLKRLGVSCSDERLVKLLSLSFETMVIHILKSLTDVVPLFMNSFRFVHLLLIVLV